ncbi:hypothetical protein ABT298_33335 [Streptomyces sp. NPDC001034]|uniref:hypothetical protein n=1 Tax=Streptomyces sp. NPDC001034 TaxID=3154375 RepID=UPI0033336F00
MPDLSGWTYEPPARPVAPGAGARCRDRPWGTRSPRGLPRSVSNIAWRSLVAAFTEDKGIVDESSTRVAVTETHATE